MPQQFWLIVVIVRVNINWLNIFTIFKVFSLLPDKFAGKAYKFVEIDSQALAESRAEETLPCDETVVE